uniref:Uncharacterized protein n=1 Tax=Romanomermis culicivorax TaxID=13658 RepID=A0A915I0U8_ROMCU
MTKRRKHRIRNENNKKVDKNEKKKNGQAMQELSMRGSTPIYNPGWLEPVNIRSKLTYLNRCNSDWTQLLKFGLIRSAMHNSSKLKYFKISITMWTLSILTKPCWKYYPLLSKVNEFGNLI